MAYITKEVEIDVDLDDFEVEELLDELHARGVAVDNEELETVKGFLHIIYEKKILGKDYSQDLNNLIFYTIGKIV